MTRPLANGIMVASIGLAALVARPVDAASGADRGFGYTWRDGASGATFDSVAFPVPVNRITPADDAPPTGPVAVGFTDGFPFYGQTYTQFWISDNGWIAFSNPGSNAWPTPNRIPNPTGPVAMVAPLWTDLHAFGAAQAINYGYNAALNIFRIQWLAIDPGVPSNPADDAPVSFDLLLFPDGRIKFQYASVARIGGATIGIEKAPTADDGIEIAAAGSTTPGVSMRTNYVVEFLPPSLMAPTCGAIPPIACGATNGSSPAFGTNVRFYGCNTQRWAAQEARYALTLADPTSVAFSLAAATPLAMILLDACDERRCIAGPGTSFTARLAAGTYYLVVDGPTPAAQGTFTATLTCTPLATRLACGSSASGTTVGGARNWAPYACAATRDESGPEVAYSVTVPSTTNLRASLTSGAATEDVLILDARPGVLSAGRCLAWGDQSAVAWDVPAGNYLVVVDGAAGSGGTFTVDTSCQIALDCSAPDGVIDFAAGRVQRVTGDTSAGADVVESYSCDAATLYDGPESLVQIVLGAPGQIAVHARSAAPGLAFFLTSDCNEGTCVGFGAPAACGTELQPGTYWLIVDGSGGASGAFDLDVVYEETYNRWDACELPHGATGFSDTSRDSWDFSDQAFCTSDPASHNYPDGCTFAMYATVRCGAVLHLPLLDVEGAVVRIFDVLAGQYVPLVAVSEGGWYQRGTQIEWQDTDCITGADPRWHQVITDVSIDDTSPRCGVFRLEFMDLSGNIWELHANCVGDSSPQFTIHDSLCAALADYVPLPDVHLVSATASYACPDVSVTYVLTNDGCGDANSFPVTLYDGATVVATDTVPVLASGQAVTRTFSGTFAGPTGAVSLVADGLSVVTECSEVPDGGCRGATTDRIALAGCTGTCDIVASAVATPVRICAGATLSIDAGSSTASQCPGGGLEYQLRGPTGTLTWRGTSLFGGLAPTTGADYDVDARCATSPACTATMTVSVLVDRAPLLDPVSVQATDVAPCNLGMVVTWAPATFFGTSGAGTYSLYRSTVSCADALAQGPILIGYGSTTYADPATAPGDTYYYVVEAEDATRDSSCALVGPRNRGAATRVAASGGTCAGVVEDATVRTDLLPHVGGTLRIGGDRGDGTRRYAEAFVELRWSTDAPLDVAANEHFHVYRSALPDVGFGLVTDDVVPLQSPGFTDAAADQPNDATYLWYYVVYVADLCDDENAATDGGTGGPP